MTDHTTSKGKVESLVKEALKEAMEKRKLSPVPEVVAHLMTEKEDSNIKNRFDIDFLV